MPIIQSSTVVNKSAKETYALLRSLDSFPQFISGVENIKVRRISPRQVVSEWTIKIAGTTISWREKDFFEDDLLTIKFRMIDGDFASYGGEWRVLENGTSSQVSLSLSIDWGILNVTEEVSNSLERKAKLATRWMMRHLRRVLGYQSVLSQELHFDTLRTVSSELIHYHNKSNQNIAAYYDHPKKEIGNKIFVVIPPGYGETKRDSLSIAYYLAHNGFHIIRYDATNHVGESDGEPINTTLGQFRDDLIATLDYVEHTFGVHKIGVVASSLAKRVAIKAAVLDKRIALIVGLVGIVDLRSTLQTIYKEDMIGQCIEGKRWGVTDILGLEVSGHFLENAIANGYHDLETTQTDLKNLSIPVVFLVAENDVWVRLDQVKLVVESASSSPAEMLVIPDALHRLEENPRAARFALRQIVGSCSKYLLYKPILPDDIAEPPLREIAMQNKLEKDRLRARAPINRNEERRFWNNYLSRYYILIKSPDYRTYLSDIFRFIGTVSQKDFILDAGCGNGHLGAWIISDRNIKINNDRATEPSFLRYTGVDLSESALRDAQFKHCELESHHQNKLRTIRKSYVLSDLNQALPFLGNSFTIVCCSLVISYLDDPVATLKELFRVLKPGGRIVITSLKPQNDLSLIYRNFVDTAQSEDEVREGRRLLSSAGQIRIKEREGQYQFFSKTELVAMLSAVGAHAIESCISFGNQAFIASGIKPPK